MYRQHCMWDRLRTCVVGRSWPPEFYAWIPDATVRNHMETIALETEQDLAGLTACLQGLGVEVIRPNIQIDVNCNDLPKYIQRSKPPMNPGDDLLMLGSTLVTSFVPGGQDPAHFDTVVQHVAQQGNAVQATTVDSLCGAGVYQLDTGIFYTVSETERGLAGHVQDLILQSRSDLPVHRMHQYGHIDGWFTPVTPGLIIAWDDPDRPQLLDMFFDRYFSGWEVVKLPPTLIDVSLFQRWKDQHNGDWWLPGQEDNIELTRFINTYFSNWLGNVSETAFDLNMSVIDSRNCIVSHYNRQVFDAFARHGVTAHIAPLRYANFWDGGIHCVTTELHRQN